MPLDPAFERTLLKITARLSPVDQLGQLVAEPGVTLAAVTLLLRPASTGRDSGNTRTGEDGTEILFIKRAERTGDPWSGHLAFPGGRANDGDATLLETAIRETAEEVGIDARQGGRLLGMLPTLRPFSTRIPTVAVTPFVVLAPEGAVPRLQAEEVQDAFWMSIAALRSGGTSAMVRWEGRDGVRELPAFPSPKGPIWGITERILSQFLSLTWQLM